MGAKKKRELPARLKGVRRRFERWRGTHRIRSRIPEPLWNAAVKMAGVYGIHRTARALRVDYYSLKKRAEQGIGIDARDRKRIKREAADAKSVKAGGAAATFLELAPLGRAPLEPNQSGFPGDLRAGCCECTMELEDAAGAKMRVYLKGAVMPDLAVLCRNFRRGEP